MAYFLHYHARGRQKEMKIKIKIITPVHIGSGEEISPMEYFIDRDKGVFHRLNMDSLFQDEKFKPYRERFIKEAGRSRYIGQIIQDQTLLRRHILYTLSISPEARQHIITNPTNIKAFIKSAGRSYIPGSSLKGSLLSALIWHVFKDNYRKLNDNQKREVQNIFFEKNRNKASEILLEKAFSWIAPKSKLLNPKFARWIDVSDSYLRSCHESLQISLVKVKGAKTGRQLPILYESLKEGQVFESEIKSQDSGFSEKEILQIAHDFYSRVVNKDEAGFKYAYNLPTVPYLVRLGQGATAFSTSLLLLSEDLGFRYFLRAPRTRKRIDDGIPMGFVQISVDE